MHHCRHHHYKISSNEDGNRYVKHVWCRQKNSNKYIAKRCFVHCRCLLLLLSHMMEKLSLQFLHSTYYAIYMYIQYNFSCLRVHSGLICCFFSLYFYHCFCTSLRMNILQRNIFFSMGENEKWLNNLNAPREKKPICEMHISFFSVPRKKPFYLFWDFFS